MSELLRHSDLPSTLSELSSKMENVGKGVVDFLEEKRGSFPRFYFLSNNEMVDVMVRWGKAGRGGRGRMVCDDWLVGVMLDVQVHM